MDIITVDFETFFDRENYTLSKMTTESYVRDPRFEPDGVGLKVNDGEAQWFEQRHVEEVLRSIDWSQFGFLAHHCQFDALIASHYYGVVPAAYFDTYSMARAVHGQSQKKGFFSLAKLCEMYSLEEKIVPYDQMSGRHWNEMDAWLQDLVGKGCMRDCDNEWRLFNLLSERFPDTQYRVVDLAIRMFARPLLRANTPKLLKIWEDEEHRKVEDLNLISANEKELQSSAKFCKLLTDAGVEVEYKPSPQIKDKFNPAIAKTDDFMKELLEHPDPYVQALARARLGVKSTQLQGYAEKLGGMADRGAIAIYLNCPGALTGRFSGGDDFNSQNIKRGSPLFECMEAPPGYVAAVLDESQIECRMLATLSGQLDEIDKFRNGHDPYIGIASQFYGHEVTKKDEAKRGMGKQSILMCGYQAGWKKYRLTAKLGLYGPPVIMSEEDARRAVALYRHTHPQVVQFWETCNSMITYLANGTGIYWDPVHVKDHRITLPSGFQMIYDSLEWHQEEDESGWRMKHRGGWTRMYSGRLTEHICSGLSQTILQEAMLRIAATGIPIVHTVHDSLWLLLKQDGTEKEALDFCIREMCKSPEWLPDIPLAVEGHMGPHFGKPK